MSYDAVVIARQDGQPAVTIYLPPSRFPDRDMTPGEVFRHERALSAGIRRESQAALLMRRYWTNREWREERKADTRRRKRAARAARESITGTQNLS